MKRNHQFCIVLILILFISTSCSPKTSTVSKAPKSIEFISNESKTLTNILDDASSKNKIVFLDFTADWCLPCQLMEEEVFNQSSVYSLFNKSFINYKVDVDKTNGANLKLMYDASQLPTYIFLDNKGRIIRKITGSLTQTELINQAKSVLAL